MLGAFPLEIYADVIQHLKHDRNALRTISLLCHPFLPISQRYLFLRVVLHPTLTPGGATAAQLKRILTRSPHIGAYIEDLELHLCPDKTPWTGWSSSLDFCLRHLSCLRALAVKFDQTAPCFAGFCTRPSVDKEAAERLMQALIRAVQLPSLRSLEASCMDVSLLLGHCLNIKELTISKPVMPMPSLADNGPPRPVMIKENQIFLETLRVESAESDNEESRLIRDMLSNQGISLGKLKHLSRVAWSYGGGGMFMKELWDILEECGESLESLEIQVQLNAMELDSLDWTKFKLPSLRTLHLHLCSNEPQSALAPYIPPFIHALMDLCVPSSSSDGSPHTTSTFIPSSVLQHLILIDHNPSWAPDGIDLGSTVLQILSDRRHFPCFERLAWYASPATIEYYRENQAFLDMQRTLLFEVDIGLAHVYHDEH